VITKQEAELIVHAYLQDSDLPLRISTLLTIDFRSGWMFFYEIDRTDSRYHNDQLAGNGPIIVSRADGSLHECGSAEPHEFYIENFEKYGLPYPPGY
jgi:Immunity protein 35